MKLQVFAIAAALAIAGATAASAQSIGVSPKAGLSGNAAGTSVNGQLQNRSNVGTSGLNSSTGAGVGAKIPLGGAHTNLNTGAGVK